MTGQITALGFEWEAGSLRPSVKHRDRFARWALEENHPRTREQLEEFLYLLPYLKELIPGRAAKTLVLKTAYQVQVSKKTPTGRVSKQKEWNACAVFFFLSIFVFFLFKKTLQCTPELFIRDDY